MLRKFKVVSNPRKFALYEVQLSNNSKRRLRRFEEPLVLQLLWGGNNEDFILSLQVRAREILFSSSTAFLFLILLICCSHVIQESNEDGQFNWEDFSLPELENFLRILEQEESEAVSQVRKRFELKRFRLEEALGQATAPEANSLQSMRLPPLPGQVPSVVKPVLPAIAPVPAHASRGKTVGPVGRKSPTPTQGAAASSISRSATPGTPVTGSTSLSGSVSSSSGGTSTAALAGTSHNGNGSQSGVGAAAGGRASSSNGDPLSPASSRGNGSSPLGSASSPSPSSSPVASQPVGKLGADGKTPTASSQSLNLSTPSPTPAHPNSPPTRNKFLESNSRSDKADKSESSKSSKFERGGMQGSKVEWIAARMGNATATASEGSSAAAVRPGVAEAAAAAAARRGEC